MNYGVLPSGDCKGKGRAIGQGHAFVRMSEFKYAHSKSSVRIIKILLLINDWLQSVLEKALVHLVLCGRLIMICDVDVLFRKDQKIWKSNLSHWWELQVVPICLLSVWSFIKVVWLDFPYSRHTGIQLHTVALLLADVTHVLFSMHLRWGGKASLGTLFSHLGKFDGILLGRSPHFYMVNSPG